MFYKLLLSGLLFLLISFNINSQNCISIIDEPQDQIIVTNNSTILTNNSSLNLTIEATSSSTLSYQWEIFNNSTGEWDEISESSEFIGTSTNTLLVSNINSLSNNDLIRVLVSTADNSCTPIPSREIEITKLNIIVHNFFTPNNDGFNDTFEINGLTNPLFQNNTVKIFNRWGNIVFEKSNYQNDWDGTPNSSFSIKSSKKLPVGTYFYTLDLDYRNIKLSGWLFIKL